MQSQGTQFNPRASLDAAVALSLFFGRYQCRASEPGCSATSHAMHAIRILWFVLTLGATGCSKQAPENIPAPQIPPTHGTRTFELGLRTGGLANTNILSVVEAFAKQQSLPSRGHTKAKGWPELTFGFGNAPSYDIAYFMVGLGADEARFQLTYNGTNYLYFDGLCRALRENADSNFTGRVLSTRTD